MSPTGEGDSLYTIGRVVEILRKEFPDLSISKVRYLEDRELLRPGRSKGGYRTYSAGDLRRLRTVLSLQRDEFLPLEVIRERLDRGTAVPSRGALPSQAPAEGARGTLREVEPMLSLDEVLQETGVDADFVNQLAEYRLIDVSARALGDQIRQTDLEIIRICSVFARFGVEPRNLRLLKSSAEREAALLEQAVTALLRSSHEERRTEGEKNLRELGGLTARLVELLLFKELRRLIQ